MLPIGEAIRILRIRKRLTAKEVASQLKKPVTEQAFCKAERESSFKAETVKEIAEILGVKPSYFFKDF